MRKNINRVMSLLLAAVLVIGCVTGCGKEEKESSEASSNTPVSSTPSSSVAESSKTEDVEEPVDYKDVEFRIGWWGGDARHNSTIALIEEFEKDYQNLKIDVEYTAFADYFTKLTTQATGGELPDIVQMDYKYIKSYVESGQLLALDDYIASGALDFTNVPDSAVSAGILNGQMYAVVTGINAPAYAYNPGLLEKAGVTISETPTIDEYIEVCKKVYDETGAMASDMSFVNFCRVYGEHYYAEDGKSVGFSEDTLVKYWEFLSDGIKYGYFEGPNTKITDYTVAMAEEKLWSMAIWSNGYENYVNTSGKELGMFALPCSEANQAPSYMNPTMFWAITSTCKNPELAVEFLNYFVNNKVTYDICGTDRGTPISTEMRTYIQPSLTPAQQESVDFLEFIEGEGCVSKIDAPNPGAASEVSAIASEYRERVQYETLEKKDYAAAAKEMIEKANAILSAAK